MNTTSRLQVNEQRLWADLNMLSTFSLETPNGGVTRRAWSKEYVAAQKWLVQQFEEAGLVPEIDVAGNIWGKWNEGALPAVVIGSHIDSVPSGGRFDGCLGVVGGLEAIRALKESGYRPRHQIWVVAWMEEEGSAFGAALFGSRAFVGDHQLDFVGKLQNSDGQSLKEVMEAAGHNWSDLEKLPDSSADVACYLELHIEQGPMLENERTSVGVVTHIVGIECGKVQVSGRANHAGGTPMNLRQDASLAAAHAMLMSRDLAIKRGVRVTTGKLEIQPGAINVIPGYAEFSVDARHHDSTVLSKYIADLVDEWTQSVNVDGKISLRYSSVYTLAPVPLDEDLQRTLRQACEDLSVSCRDMVSGAGHDAMVLAPRVPTAMIFVPSHEGISHSREEFTESTDCARGALVLASVISRLASEAPSRV